MPAIPLQRRSVHKVWGRRDVPAMFGPVAADEQPLGEVWFESEGEACDTLLVKYLFTSEKLSIQVHPDDEMAQRAGHRCGKDEAWIVLAAEPDATIGVGLTREVSKDELRAAALDGSIEELTDWRPAKRGDILYSPAGTVHALGPGLTLIEVQQNVDLTYRLYDYGRPRELHLEEGMAAAEPKPFVGKTVPRRLGEGRELLFEGPKFVLERWTGHGGMIGSPQDPVWLIPVSGEAKADGDSLSSGSVYLAQEATELNVAAGSELFVTYAGAQLRFS